MIRYIQYCFFLIVGWTGPLHGEWIQPPAVNDSGYPVPQPYLKPKLPAAHGAHRAYAIEWWYWVGHLEAVADGRRFGFQSTVFRLAGEASGAVDTETSGFGERQLFMSHAALSDFTEKTYVSGERVYREGWQAKAASGHLDLKVGAITATELKETAGFSMNVRYDNQRELRLKMRPLKPMSVFGERGLSRKGSDPAAVSWYWTYTRLEVEGVLLDGEDSVAVKGIAWMDHEISSNQLGSDLEGWDWTCMQLDDGTEVKAYRLRTKNGASDPWSAVYWIDANGSITSIYADAFTWQTDKLWESKQSGIRYPTSVSIIARDPRDGSKKTYRLRPLLQEQEFLGNDASNPYWEGACEVFNEKEEKIGVAYLELAGYGGGLMDRLN